MNGAILPDPIELVALDPARNIWRRYSITASFDLFGMIVVETPLGPDRRLGSGTAACFCRSRGGRSPYRRDLASP